jgi:catechol 2,3-dioxygenase-like lactoylglutathione lyase family enzyme
MDGSAGRGGAAMRLRCVNIVSADPKRLAAFYETVLGANTDASHGGPNRIEIKDPDGNDVDLVQALQSPTERPNNSR